MKHCPDMDDLVSLGSALGWQDPLDALRHLAACGHCQERLAQLGAIRHTFTRELSPHPGFVDSVVSSTAGARSRRPGGRRRFVAGDLVSPILAALTALAAIGLAAEGGVIAPGPGAVAGALLAGAATLAWNRSSGRSAV